MLRLLAFSISKKTSYCPFETERSFRRYFTMNSNSSWEELRKEARSLENQIDSKLVELSRLGTSLKSPSPDFGSSTSDKTPLLLAEDNPVDATEKDFDRLIEELDGLLSRLTSINSSLNDWADKNTSSAATSHTLQRHREILKDYRQEYLQTKNNISTLIKRHELFDSKSSQRRSGGSGDFSSNIRMDLLLKESEHARNSEKLIDDQITIAMEARDSLYSQRDTFKAIQKKLNDISNRFPMVNNLIQKINLRKRRDAIIVAIVIGLCLTFLLWWILS